VELPVEVVVLALDALAGQCGQDADAVEVVGSGDAEWKTALHDLPGLRATIATFVVADAGHLAEGRHQVVEGEGLVALAAGRDVAWPAHDEGDAYAAFVGAALQSAELAVVVEVGGVGSSFLVRTVVTGEDEHGVAGQSLFFEHLHDLAHLMVQAGDHRCELGVCLRGGIVARGVVALEFALGQQFAAEGLQQGVVRLAQFGVRQRVGEDAEEGLVLALAAQPLECALVDDIGAVLPAVVVVRAVHGVPDVLLQYLADDGRVAPRAAEAVEEVGEVEVCLELTDVAEELVHAALVGGGGAAFVAAGPLAEHPRPVAFSLEDFRQDDVRGGIGLLSDDGVVLILAVQHTSLSVLLVAAHVEVSRVLSRHQRGTGGGGDGAAGVGGRHSHALGGQPVDVGSAEVLLAVAREVAISHVITHYI